ncbi:MAG TPA: hypothetical protein VJW96_10910 [Terriglobales bacterium]|jgi:hypothetical protein|nr:hypothetical protein [Terriglobales bacterium]
MKHRDLLLTLFLLAVFGSASASITEIRKNFFNRTTNLHATAIMSAPTGDASYLITVYESTESCTIVPVLRWTDENGVAQSQQGSVGPGGGNCYLSLLANIRVQAKTKPTIETSGDDSGSDYSLYVSGLGFWPSGVQGQGGLSEVTGSLPTRDLVYALPAYGPAGSTNALLIAYSTGYAGKDVPYVSWTDEYNTHSLQVPVAISVVVPVRIAGGTKVWIHTYPGDTTWYALVVFGAPATGAGPFGDYEANLLDWTSATYPNWQTIFTAGSAGSNVLLLGNVTQPANDGTVSEGLQIYWAKEATGSCAAALVAGPSGIPASCVSPAFVGSNSPLQFRTYNSIGSPWGPSPTYSAEVDVLQF